MIYMRFAIHDRMDECARVINEKYGERNTLNEIKLIFNDRDICKYAVSFIYGNGPMNNRQLAYALPNKARNWDSYTVYKKEIVANDDATQVTLLAHELGHILYGQMAGEEDADYFAEKLLGIDNYRDRILEIANEYGM